MESIARAHQPKPAPSPAPTTVGTMRPCCILCTTASKKYTIPRVTSLDDMHSLPLGMTPLVCVADVLHKIWLGSQSFSDPQFAPAFRPREGAFIMKSRKAGQAEKRKVIGD